MEIRIAREEDRGDVERLWDYCFEKRDDPFFRWFFTRHYKKENTLASFRNGRMATCLHLMPYRLFLRGRVLPASFIVGLAAFPEARGTGDIRRLLDAALQESRARGQFVNILMPSKPGYYHPLQWELCYHQYKYSLPLEDLRRLAIAGGVFQTVRSDADWFALQTVYETFTEDKHGYAIRDEYYWRRIIEEHTADGGFVYLVTFDGVPGGYVFYHLVNKKLTVREMAWTNETALGALFRFLYQHRSQASHLEWQTPVEDLTCCRLPNPENQVMLQPFMAGRVVDAVQALNAITYAPEISLRTVLQIQDEFVPWHSQAIELEVSAGSAHCKYIDTTTPEFSCSIGTFSQLFFGRISAKNMYKSGRVQTNFPGNIAKLDMLFPPRVNYINEYY